MKKDGALRHIRCGAVPANNYFTWKDKCLAKSKIGRTVDKLKLFIHFKF